MENEKIGEKKVSYAEYTLAAKNLRNAMKSKQIDYFDYLNLTSDTSMRYLRHALTNKLALSLHSIMGEDLLNEIANIIEIYLVLSDEKKAAIYFEKLSNSKQKLIEELNQFLQVRTNYIKSNRRNNTSSDMYAFVTNNYINYLENNYAKASYSIDYDDDFNDDEMNGYNSLLKDIKSRLSELYQDYCTKNKEHQQLDSVYLEILNKLDAIAVKPKKDDSLIKKL